MTIPQKLAFPATQSACCQFQWPASQLHQWEFIASVFHQSVSLHHLLEFIVEMHTHLFVSLQVQLVSYRFVFDHLFWVVNLIALNESIVAVQLDSMLLRIIWIHLIQLWEKRNLRVWNFLCEYFRHLMMRRGKFVLQQIACWGKLMSHSQEHQVSHVVSVLWALTLQSTAGTLENDSSSKISRFSLLDSIVIWFPTNTETKKSKMKFMWTKIFCVQQGALVIALSSWPTWNTQDQHAILVSLQFKCNNK